MNYDNVYSSNISKDVIEIRAAHCSEENLKKEIITDDDVENPKTFLIAPSYYTAFIYIVVTVGVQLQTSVFDIGLNLEEISNDEHTENQEQ